MTLGILDSVKIEKLQRVLEFSGRKSYKIPVNAFPQFPDHIASDLKSLKKVSSTFAGKRGQKVQNTCSVFISFTLSYINNHLHGAQVNFYCARSYTQCSCVFRSSLKLIVLYFLFSSLCLRGFLCPELMFRSWSSYPCISFFDSFFSHFVSKHRAFLRFSSFQTEFE